MNKLNKEDLQNILNKHKLWLFNEEGGECADLRYTDLRYVNLRYTDLRYANLRGANLRGADLRYTDLRYANLRGANLRGADLRYTDLRYANLRYTDLRYANLSDAKLSDADLRYADLRGVDLRFADLSNVNLRYVNLSDANLRYANLKYADLSDAKLSDADLKNIKTNMYTIGYHLACPEKGSFIGYKKANKHLVKLLILEDSKRSSATTTKCRCDKAKVLSITNIRTGEEINKIASDYDKNFIYKVGEIVEVKDFDNDRWNECSTGIHFFVNKENAINYQ